MTNDSKSTAVKVLNGALDESDMRGGSLVLRGTLDWNTLVNLKVDTYQRAAGSPSELEPIVQAWLGKSPVPGIVLGMRGVRCREAKDGTMSLLDEVFIIDGLQRTSAAKRAMGIDPGCNPRVGFELHFETDYKFEKEFFEILNKDRKKVNSSILIRNNRDESRATAMLYGLTRNQKDFALYQRVAWDQKMARNELMSVMTLMKVVGHLLGHVAAGRYVSYQDLVPALDRIADIGGLQRMRENVHTFFEIVDQCWGIRLVTYKDGAPHLKGQFLMTLARVFSEHVDFWKDGGKTLFLNADMRRKLAGFNIHDPHVKNLCSSSGKSRDILRQLLIDHMNSGKRQHRLTEREDEVVPAAPRGNRVKIATRARDGVEANA